ncbi:hypothetical protein C2G38_2189819 [Gigaspora rosea]|uniref:Uncharacterized protein n=1 Tax=Gigaspora rosea TaxID=44941 RepID=A0A397V217_9GLOM|nr:hypothetical protein C2G38_2189819 [Gigaspora rosea]
MAPSRHRNVYVVAHLNKLVIIEEFEEYAMEEDEIQPDQIDQRYNFSMIGYFHEHGIGTDVDYHKAFWMHKLSSEIDDYIKSFEWYLKSAECWNSDAQNNVAKCYMNGY